MPLTKTWANTATAYGTQGNWQAVSVRNSAYAWTASGSGTNEYYLRTAGGADPGIVASPPTSNGVFIAGVAATKGTVGSLTSGQWGYDDNDTLGYDTLYVRLSGGGDPDAQLADHVVFYQIPQTGEHVRIPSSSGSILSDLDQSAVAIGDFIIDDGHSSTIGVASTASYLRIDPNKFICAGQGTYYIDLTTAAIDISVLASGSGAGAGYRGMYLRGSAIATADIRGGNIGIAYLGGETSTVTTLRLQGNQTDVIIGSGCGLTTVHIYSGSLRLRCSAAVTTILQWGGTCYLEEACAATTVDQRGGDFYWNSSGNIGTINGYGGTFHEETNGLPRTVTTVNRYNSLWNYIYNKEAVTHTNKVDFQVSGQI